MTKNEQKLVLQSVMSILDGYRDQSQDIIDYLYTDILMQITDDLEAIRKKDFPLPMSGIKG